MSRLSCPELHGSEDLLGDRRGGDSGVRPLPLRLDRRLLLLYYPVFVFYHAARVDEPEDEQDAEDPGNPGPGQDADQAAVHHYGNPFLVMTGKMLAFMSTD